jgi:hypothetical protein
MCRAIPEDSKKYFRTVCVAGLTSSGELRRLYPVPFKPFQRGAGIPFHKKDWIRADLSAPEDKRDQRAESRKVNMDTIEVLEKANDDEIREAIVPRLSPSIASIEASGASLGFIKPRIIDYDIEIISTDLVDKQQVALNADGSVSPAGLVKLKQESKYMFSCAEKKSCTCMDKPHKMEIHDWEVNELYRNVIARDKKPPIIEQKMKQRWFHWMTKERDMYFMMGTHHRWKSWMIVSVLYLRKPGDSKIDDNVTAQNS